MWSSLFWLPLQIFWCNFCKIIFQITDQSTYKYPTSSRNETLARSRTSENKEFLQLNTFPAVFTGSSRLRSSPFLYSFISDSTRLWHNFITLFLKKMFHYLSSYHNIFLLYVSFFAALEFEFVLVRMHFIWFTQLKVITLYRYVIVFILGVRLLITFHSVVV